MHTNRVNLHLLNPLLVTDSPPSIKRVQRFKNRIFAHEHPAVDEIWERFGDLVVHMRARGHREDVVQLFQRALLGFWHPEEDHYQGDDVGPSVETEHSL